MERATLFPNLYQFATGTARMASFIGRALLGLARSVKGVAASVFSRKASPEVNQDISRGHTYQEMPDEDDFPEDYRRFKKKKPDGYIFQEVPSKLFSPDASPKHFSEFVEGFE